MAGGGRTNQCPRVSQTESALERGARRDPDRPARIPYVDRLALLLHHDDVLTDQLVRDLAGDIDDVAPVRTADHAGRVAGADGCAVAVSQEGADGRGQPGATSLVGRLLPPGFPALAQGDLDVVHHRPGSVALAPNQTAGTHQLGDELGPQLVGDAGVGRAPFPPVHDDVVSIRCALDLFIRRGRNHEGKRRRGLAARLCHDPVMDAINLQLDFSGAEALLRALELDSISDTEMDELLRVPGVRATVANTHKYQVRA